MTPGTNESTLALQRSEHTRVLLLSQDELICFTLQNFFKDSHIYLVAVSKRDEALMTLKKKKFDAIISDICTDAAEGILFRHEIRMQNLRIPILFMTPLFYWSDVRLLERIVEDPHSYYVPENADKKFLLAKLHQVINAYHAENALHSLKIKIARSNQLASFLQQAMLPPWVYFNESYEFSYLYHPFTLVSGDLFEWFPLDNDRALFIFGDVSGHGTHSALAMTAVQSFLKQIILLDKEKATHPWQIANEINEFFCHHLHNIVYMSTLIAYADFKNNCIRYQNAGYMDPICIDADTGKLIDINPAKTGSLPLGMMKKARYTVNEDIEYHFTDSTVFLFFSDGLTDLSKDKAGENYMDMSVCRKLASILAVDAQKEEKSIAIPFRCYHSLKQFDYLFPQDDLSMVMLRKPIHIEKEYVFSCCVPADKAAVDRVCEKASGFVEQFYHDEELSVNTELLLEEYLVNVILHGLNEYEKLNAYIAVKLCAYDKELKLIVWDHGKEWNGVAMHGRKAEETLDVLNESMSSNGRGLPIINKIASQISRQRYSGLNETIFIIPLPGGKGNDGQK